MKRKFYHTEVHTAVRILKEIGQLPKTAEAPLDIFLRQKIEVAIYKISSWHKRMISCFGKLSYLPEEAYIKTCEFALRAGNRNPDPELADSELLDFLENCIPEFRKVAEFVVSDAQKRGFGDSGNDVITPEQVLKEIGAEKSPGLIFR